MLADVRSSVSRGCGSNGPRGSRTISLNCAGDRKKFQVALDIERGEVKHILDTDHDHEALQSIDGARIHDRWCFYSSTFTRMARKKAATQSQTRYRICKPNRAASGLRVRGSQLVYTSQ